MSKVNKYYFIIILTGLLLYVRCLNFDFIYLDDNVWILDHQWFLKDIHNTVHLFTQPDLISKVFYRPLLNLSFILNAQFAHESAAFYRLINLAIHLFNGCLIFTILGKMLNRERLAFFLALLFTVHPILTQAVVWIPGRTDSLLALSVLLSFNSFLNYLYRGKIGSFIGHMIFMGCALFIKETAIVLPVICGLYYFLVSDKGRAFKPLALHWLFVLSVWFFLRSYALHQKNNLELDRMVNSIGENFPTIFSYIGKIFLPFQLTALSYPANSPYYPGITAIVLLAVAVFVSQKRDNRLLVFGLAWFVLFMLPGLVISFLNQEYRAYLPLVGCLIVVSQLDVIKTRMQVPICIGLAVVFIGLTFVHSGHFKDRFTYWHAAVKSAPDSPLAHRNLGAMYHLKDDYDKALAEYKIALELNPNEAMVHNNIGLIYTSQGDPAQAERYYLREIAINPEYDNVHFNLGLLYYKHGRLKEAVAYWRKTIALNPRYVDAYKYLAVHFYNAGDHQAAVPYFRELQKRGIEVPVAVEAVERAK